MQKGNIALLVIILVAVVAGYWFTINYSNKRTETTPVASQTNPTPKPVESTSSADMANWKTYTNTKIGFQIQYPSNWEYSEVKAGDPLHLYLYPKHTGEMKSRDPNEALSPVELVIINNSSPLPCLAKDNKSCLELKVDGVSAKKYSLENYHEVVTFKNKKGDLFFELMTPKFDKETFATESYKQYYSFYNLPEKERKNIFDQILSTFKFLP